MNRTKYLNSEIKRLRVLLKCANTDKLKQTIQTQIDKLEEEKMQEQRSGFLFSKRKFI